MALSPGLARGISGRRQPARPGDGGGDGSPDRSERLPVPVGGHGAPRNPPRSARAGVAESWPAGVWVAARGRRRFPASFWRNVVGQTRTRQLARPMSMLWFDVTSIHRKPGTEPPTRWRYE